MAKLLCVLFISFCMCVSYVSTKVLFLDEGELQKLSVNTVKSVTFVLNETNSDNSSNDPNFVLVFSLRCLEPDGIKNADIVSDRTFFVRQTPLNITLDIAIYFLGYFELNYKLLRLNETVESGSYRGSAIPTQAKTNILFTVMIAFIIFVNYCAMGCQLDVNVIRKTLKKPIGPLIGLGCQFLIMPTTSYAVGYLVLYDRYAWRLGLFMMGCSPGGTASNFWTLIFNGDVDLSVTMTVISIVASLGMMPLWLFGLGSHLSDNADFKIPYVRLISTLFALITPLFIGIVIKHKKPKWAEYSRKIIRPLTICVCIIMLVFTIVVYNFMIRMFTWRIIFAGFCVAATGYVLGAIIAFICGLPREQIIAISIETAFQNMGIGFVALQLTLSSPEVELATTPMIAQMLVTSQPLWWWYLVHTIFNCILKWRRGCKTDPKKSPDVENKHNDLLLLEKKRGSEASKATKKVDGEGDG